MIEYVWNIYPIFVLISEIMLLATLCLGYEYLEVLKYLLIPPVKGRFISNLIFHYIYYHIQ